MIEWELGVKVPYLPASEMQLGIGKCGDNLVVATSAFARDLVSDTSTFIAMNKDDPTSPFCPSQVVDMLHTERGSCRTPGDSRVLCVSSRSCDGATRSQNICREASLETSSAMKRSLTACPSQGKKGIHRNTGR